MRSRYTKMNLNKNSNKDLVRNPRKSKRHQRNYSSDSSVSEFINKLPLSNKQREVLKEKIDQNEKNETFRFQGGYPIHWETINNIHRMKTMEVVLTEVVKTTPSRKVHILLRHIHQVLKNSLLQLDKEGLNWLIQGSVGGKNISYEDANELISFLNKKPKELTTDELIIGIEKIIGPISYRMVSAPWGQSPIDPMRDPNAIPAQKNAQRLIEKMKQFLVASIRVKHPKPKIKENKSLHSTSISIHPSSKLLNVVDCVVDGPFVLFDDDGGITPMGERASANIPVQGGASGSVPLALATLEGFLCYQHGDHYQSWNDNTIIEMAAAMFMTAYVTHNYHTINETMEGILFYLSERQANDSSESEHDYIQTFKGALDALVKVSHPSKRHEIKNFIDQALLSYGPRHEKDSKKEEKLLMIRAEDIRKENFKKVVKRFFEEKPEKADKNTEEKIDKNVKKLD